MLGVECVIQSAGNCNTLNQDAENKFLDSVERFVLTEAQKEAADILLICDGVNELQICVV